MESSKPSRVPATPTTTPTMNKKTLLFFTITVVSVVTVFLQSSRSTVLLSPKGFSQEIDKPGPIVLRNGSNVNGSSLVDVHPEDGTHAHSTAIQPSKQIGSDTAVIKIALGGSLTSRGTNATAADMKDKILIFTILMPSFCKTLSKGYEYAFYHAFDVDDPVFMQGDLLNTFQQTWTDTVLRLCPKDVSVTLHMVQCSHTQTPAWAQNDALMEAYLDGAQYFYRLNDDSMILTSGWVEAFRDTLAKYNPPNVGVVGPSFNLGNTGILTHDFVHRTHVELFGFYYPRVFTDWWADDWITYVYKPGRSTKLHHIQVKHTQKLGRRYDLKANRRQTGELDKQLAQDKDVLLRYVNHTQTELSDRHKDKNKVIAMSLSGKNPNMTYGAIRNAQLMLVIYPGWVMHIFIANQTQLSKELERHWVPPKILTALQRIPWIQLMVIPPSLVTASPAMWRYLVVDSSVVDVFLIRDADNRFSEREASLVSQWLDILDKPDVSASVHCIRDHPKHMSKAITDGLWGGVTQEIKRLLPKSSMAELISTITGSKDLEAIRSMQPSLATWTADSQPWDIFRDVLWSNVKEKAYCHDSVSCDLWSNSHPITARNVKERDIYVGQSYDQFHNPINNDFKDLINSNCSTPVR